MGFEHNAPEERLLSPEGDVPEPQEVPMWQKGEIRASRAGGILFIAIFIILLAFIAAVDKSINKSSTWFMCVFVVLTFGPILLMVGGGASWDSRGIQFTWFGIPTKSINWSEGVYLVNNLKIVSRARKVYGLPSDQGPKQSSRADLATAVLANQPIDEPRVRKYHEPPKGKCNITLFRTASWILALIAIASLRIAISDINISTEAGQWPPNLSSFTFFILTGILWIASLVRLSSELSAQRFKYKWMPAPNENWRNALSSRSQSEPQRLTQKGELYAYAQRLAWTPKSRWQKSAIFVGAVYFCLLVSSMRPLRPDDEQSFLFVIGLGILGSVSMVVVDRVFREMPKVDWDAVVEVTESGLRLWKDGAVTPFLNYPRRVKGSWISNMQGGDVEVWSCGDEQHAIGRRYLVQIPDDAPPCIRYAATEGGGWLHRESKVIAAQMLAERDWSKPLPKMRQ